MRVIIAGSRSIVGEKAVELIEQAVQDTGWEINEVISGDAKGIDTAAIEWAKVNSIDLVRMPANWTGHPNKSAGYKRNQKMAWYASVAEKMLKLQGVSDANIPSKYKGGLIAIHKNDSRGTAHLIEIAKEMGLTTHIVKI